MQLVWHNCCLRVAIFATEKAKMVKDLLDKKLLIAYTSAAGIVSLTLQFLRAENEKQIRAIGLTQLPANLLLAQLPPHYDLYKRKSENRYVQPAWHSCWYTYLRITIFRSGKVKTRSCDQLDTCCYQTYSCFPYIILLLLEKRKHVLATDLAHL